MYSRFIVWQSDTKIESQSEIQDVNVFRLAEKALDIRFRLKGYGFKKVGENNRVVYHFGCYKCYYRKFGETEWTLFAHIQSERAGDNEPRVYSDVSVGTGVLEFGVYEFKIEACKLVELSNWSGGIVEGITDGDQFYYNVNARQQLPNKVGAQEDINVEEYFLQGVTPIPLFAVDPDQNLFDGIQCVEIWSVILEHNIEVFEEAIAVSDELWIEAPLDIIYHEDIPVNEAWSVGLDNLYINNVEENPPTTEIVDREREEQIAKEKLLFALLQLYRKLIDDRLSGNIRPEQYVEETDAIIQQGATLVGTVDQMIDRVLASIQEILSIGVLDYGSNSDLEQNNQIWFQKDTLVFFWTIDTSQEEVYRLKHKQEDIYYDEYINEWEKAPTEAEKDALTEAYLQAKAIRDAETEEEKLALEQKYGIYRGSADILYLEEYVHLTFYPFYSYWVENIRVQEFWDVNIFGSRQVVENISVGEYLIDVNIDGTRLRWDDVSLDEAIDVNIFGTRLVWQNITVQDVILDINLPFNRQVYESISVQDVLSILIPYSLIKFENIPVQEYIEMDVYQTTLRVENIHITEAVTVQIPFLIEAVDSVYISEFIKIWTWQASVYDYIAVNEAIFTNVEFTLNVYDSIHIAEATTVWTFAFSRFDTITIAEFVYLLFPYQINRFDSVTVSEYVKMDAKEVRRWDNITVSEFVKIELPIVVRFDNITVAEFVAMLRSPNLSAIQNVTVAEFRNVYLTVLNISVVDTVTVTESRTAYTFWYFTRFDTVTVSEFRAVSLDRLNIPTRVDNITVSEFRKIECLSPSVRDNITITEWVRAYPFYSFSVMDSVAIAEDVTAKLLWLVNVYDLISVQEFSLVSMGIQVSDIINVADILNIVIAPREAEGEDWAWVNGALTDFIEVQEYVSFYKFDVLPIGVEDIITVNESVLVGVDLIVEEWDEATVNGALVDSIFVTDIAILSEPYYIPNEIQDAYEDVGVFGALYDTISIAEFVQLVRI